MSRPTPRLQDRERRRKTLKVNIPCRGSDGPLHLPVHSTGIKVEGEGEWNTRKRGGSKRRVWRKIHFGIDEMVEDQETVQWTVPRRRLEIRAAAFTTSDVGDAPMLPEQLDQIPRGQKIAGVTAHGAFDPRKCHRYGGLRGPIRGHGPPSHHRRQQGRRHHPTPQERQALEARHSRCGRTQRDPADIEARRPDHLATMVRGLPATGSRAAPNGITAEAVQRPRCTA